MKLGNSFSQQEDTRQIEMEYENLQEIIQAELEGENLRLLSKNAELMSLLEMAKESILVCERQKNQLELQNLQLRMQIASLLKERKK